MKEGRIKQLQERTRQRLEIMNRIRDEIKERQTKIDKIMNDIIKDGDELVKLREVSK